MHKQQLMHNGIHCNIGMSGTAPAVCCRPYRLSSAAYRKLGGERGLQVGPTEGARLGSRARVAFLAFMNPLGPGLSIR